MAWLSRNRLLSQISNRHSGSSHIFTIYGFNSSDREREMKGGNAEYCAHYLSHTERRWSRKYTHICWEPHTVLRWDSHFHKQLQWREKEQTVKQLWGEDTTDSYKQLKWFFLDCFSFWPLFEKDMRTLQWLKWLQRPENTMTAQKTKSHKAKKQESSNSPATEKLTV